jgi:hypothetical protein
MMKMMFGRFAGFPFPANPLSQPAKGSAAVAALPAAKDKNSRRVMSAIFFLSCFLS